MSKREVKIALITGGNRGTVPLGRSRTRFCSSLAPADRLGQYSAQLGGHTRQLVFLFF
jgi:hypothetical protein